jgi:hypothetical protein
MFTYPQPLGQDAQGVAHQMADWLSGGWQEQVGGWLQGQVGGWEAGRPGMEASAATSRVRCGSHGASGCNHMCPLHHQQQHPGACREVIAAHDFNMPCMLFFPGLAPYG